jgi:HAD superfamily hydrolase (TIGR01509 family)
VIFDCDGVLVDSEWASAAAWAAALDRHGHRLDDEEFRGFIGRTDRSLAESYGPLLGTDSRDLLAEAEVEMRRVVRDGLAAFPDALDLLDRLEVPVAVASNSDRWRLRAVLEAAGLGSRFGVSVAGDEVARPKPAPDIYLKAARLVGIDPPGCHVIEDSPTGIRAALAAGMTVIAVGRGHFDRSALGDAHVVVESLNEPGMLGDLGLSPRG